MQCDIMAVEEPRSAVGPMAFWNPGIAHQTIWTAKKVTVRTDDGTDVIMTKRGRCLRYIIKRFQTGVVDCGLHETGVEGLERELKNIADGCAPPPAIQIHRRKSDLFLHTDRVELERFEWRPLFPDDRLRNDTRGWKSQGKDDAEINNLLNRRRWRGSLVVDVKLGACNKVRALGGSWKGGLAVLGGAAPPAEQIRIRLNFLHSLAGGCQTGRSAKKPGKAAGTKDRRRT